MVYLTIANPISKLLCNKIWIHDDGIEEGITDELVAAGVPKEIIVFAFHLLEIRQHSSYVVA